MVSKAYLGRMPLARLAMRIGSFGSLRPAPGHCRLLPIAREGILRAEVSPPALPIKPRAPIQASEQR